MIVQTYPAICEGLQTQQWESNARILREKTMKIDFMLTAGPVQASLSNKLGGLAVMKKL